jgi:hypothetical protein
MIQSWTLYDDIADAARGAIKVTVTLSDGRRRWCFFVTPAALASRGDWVRGTRVRMHLGERHIIVVSEVTHDGVECVLRELDAGRRVGAPHAAVTI